MKKIFAVALGLVMASAMAYAQENGLSKELDNSVLLIASQVPVNSSPQAEALMRLEYQLAEGCLTNDIQAIGPILANDYVALGPGGEFQTKADILGDLRYGVVQYSAIYTNPMTVRFFGTTAVVVGSDEEKSSRLGVDTSGHYDWTDVFVLRNGRWQMVASQETFMPGGPNFDVPVD